MIAVPLELYYERHGRSGEGGHGVPIVLLHGAMGTIESCFSRLLPLLARQFEVIAVELQGHGHTRDVDRPLTYEGMAADVAALLERLGTARATWWGTAWAARLASSWRSIVRSWWTISSSSAARRFI